MNRQMLSLASLIACAAFCSGDCYPLASRPVQAQAPAAVAAVKAQVDNFAFTKFLAVQLLEVPTYSAVYVPAPPVVANYGSPVTAQSQSGELREILEVLKSFDARLRRLEGAAPPVILPLPQAIPPMPKATSAGESLLQNKCAICHDAAVSGDRAGGVTLFKGTPPVVAVGERWRLKMADAIEQGRMPEMGSGVTLTAAERAAAVVYLKGLKN